MKKTYVFHNATLYSHESKIENPFIEINEGKITNLGEADPLMSTNTIAEHISFKNHVRIIPGFIDVHIHGAENADMMDGTPEAMETLSKALPKEGTTSFLATTLTQPKKDFLQALRATKSFINQESNTLVGAQVIGIHLEGPFINKRRAGAQPRDYICQPNIPLFQQFQEASGHHIRIVSLAPEKDYDGLVTYLRETGVIPSVGHSDATYNELLQGIQDGVCHATHLFNGMRGIHHRDPGVAGGALLENEITVEMIVDGIHISSPMVKFAYQHKQADGIILITDSMRAKGLKDGTYKLGGQDVFVKDGQATLKNGTLAGSILKMNDAIKNMISFTGCAFEEAVQMATYNPAKQLGICDRKGSLAIGKDGDFTIIDEHFSVHQTYVMGNKVYDREKMEGTS
ncbi:N-acetylglucosamine-6-phosphate deacetylase [Bacillus alkalicellulosilyticus]|uniref:N-acetylglucosamine-6-phosphate deacetylase n=1 Tax=Alkalihalobacterium alkalicellulosilyticum TaxID=1912214 RepID=UPI000997E6A8|nr:N-acetylglucosamine-6-phosphate deacetylase [Bacillus alkalicellulosilyticus]